MQQIINQIQAHRNSHSSVVGDLTTQPFEDTPAAQKYHLTFETFKCAKNHKIRLSSKLLLGHIGRSLFDRPNGRLYQKQATMGILMTADPSKQICKKQVGRILTIFRQKNLITSVPSKLKNFPDEQFLTPYGLVVYLVQVKGINSYQAVYNLLSSFRKCPHENVQNVPAHISHVQGSHTQDNREQSSDTKTHENNSVNNSKNFENGMNLKKEEALKAIPPEIMRKIEMCMRNSRSMNYVR